MSISAYKKRWLHFLCMTLAAVLLAACGGEDKPFSLVGDQNQPGPNPGGSAPPPGTVAGCVVNLNSEMQLKISVKKGDGSTLEKLDAKPKQMEPIPIKFDGNNIVLEGNTFPSVLLNTLGDPPPADILVHGVDGKNGTGTFDPATGKISIQDFTFGLEFFNHDTTTHILTGVYELGGVDLVTESVTATGNLNPITVEGKPYNASDKSIVLATAITLPTDFGTVFSALNGSIGGGALTATFTGTLDQDPANCKAGGGTPGPGPGGSNSGPSDFSVSVGNDTANVGSVDFKSTLVMVTNKNGKTVLDCTDASNRGALTKTITIKNTSQADLKIKINEPADTDGDKKDPLCSGGSEFVRGSVTINGDATCEKVTVGGKDFLTGTCTIPKDAKGSLSFPLMYVPFNYVAPPAGAEPAATPSATPAATPAATESAAIPDTGALLFEYGDSKTFSLSLKGISEPDTRNSLSIAKVNNDGQISKKDIPNNGFVKIAPKSSDPLPFTQPMALKNVSTDAYENVSFEFPTGSVFSVEGAEGTTLPAQTASDKPGTLKFKIKFSPDSSGKKSFSDTLTIKLHKTGSTAESVLTYTINGLVGAELIVGKYYLHVDYLTALIDNAILANGPPIESLDFRKFPEQAPQAQEINVSDVNSDGTQDVDLVNVDFDPLKSDVNDRRKALRILNARASVSKTGVTMVSGQDSSLCDEPDPITVPWTSDTRACSYFYFNLKPESTGVYDDDTGDFTIPHLDLRIQNPYHAALGGWLASTYTPPGDDPAKDHRLDTHLKISLTTFLLDRTTIEGLDLVSDDRIKAGDLNLKKKDAWKGSADYDCTSDNPIASSDKPHFKCYLTSDGKYIHGYPVNPRDGKTGEYDIVLVGAGRFNTQSEEADIPFFLSDGTNMYLVIQGRLCKDGTACEP